LAVLTTFLAFAGFAGTIWPYALPYRLSISDAAADPASLEFVLIGIAIVLPLVLTYQLYAYRVFAGKVREETYEMPVAPLAIHSRRAHESNPILHLS
jgi:cytochrome bd-type quinol oxidase subunit 2